MNLEEWKERFKGKKNNLKQIDSISEEFKKRGLERFLMLSYSEEVEYEDNTKKLLKRLNNIRKEHYRFDELYNQINAYNEEEYINIFFSYVPSENYYLACELAKKAYKHTILPNLYDDDVSKNHMVTFKKDDIENISFMLDLVRYTGTSKNQFNVYKIYGIDVLYISSLCKYKEINLCFPKPDRLTHFCGNIIRRDANPFTIIESRDVIDEIMKKNEFKNELELAYNIRERIMIPIQNMHEKVRYTGPDESKRIYLKLSKEKYSEEKTKLLTKLVSENRVPIKWKSEKAMFDTVFNLFPDAIYQYRPTWLTPQSLDVFVPSINVAFEYQGIQHFKSIDYFGGEEAYNKRVELDNKKRKLCKDNNVNIIEWNYEESITKSILVKKLREIGIK